MIRDIKNTLKICKFSIPNRWMEEEIYQTRLKLIEHFEVEIDLYTQEDHVLLCMERESLIRETFRTPIYTTMSTKELAVILESYLKKEQEDITKAGPSVKQEVGNVVIKKNISVSFPMSKEAREPHDEGHHAQNIGTTRTRDIS